MNPRAFGFANAAAYGVMMAALAWLGMAFPSLRRAVDLTAEYYPGYRATIGGGVVGGLYGLATGYLLGWFTAWLYNRFRRSASGSEFRTEVPAGARLERGAGI